MRLRKLKSSESINLKRGELLLAVHKLKTELILLQIVSAVRHSTEVLEKENEQVRFHIEQIVNEVPGHRFKDCYVCKKWKGRSWW